MQTTQTKFQRLTSDPAQTKFIILNPSSFPTTSSSILPASISSRSTTATITNKTLSAAEHNKQINLEGENLLISEALKESDETLRTVKHDNFEMRELLGEIQDWCSVIGEIKGVQLGATNDDDKDHDQVDLVSFFSPPPSFISLLIIVSQFYFIYSRMKFQNPTYQNLYLYYHLNYTLNYIILEIQYQN